MTRLVALLSWFSEDPSWLSDTVLSLPLAGVDALVAVDGSYPHFPDARPASPREQAATISDAAAAVGIGSDVAVPGKLWESECAKRTAMFHYAEGWDPDWYLVIDADERVIRAPDDLKDRLAATDRDYADVMSLEQPAPVIHSGAEGADWPQIHYSRHVKPRRCLIRAVLGTRVVGAHHHYITPDGRDLWGDEYGNPLRVSDMMIDHRNAHRDPTRRQAALDYYKARDEAGVELHAPRPQPASAERLKATNALLGRAIRNHKAKAADA